MPNKDYYVTTPLYYVNDELHLGHATTTLYADTLARFKRLDGYRVTFLTGSDEHGLKIFKAAEKAGTTPKEFADGIVGKFRALWTELGVSEHQFIRTTDEYHERVVRAVFAEHKKRDLVYKGTYHALYCTDCEAAYSPSSLEDGKCPVHRTEPVEVDEENYFFRLSSFVDALRQRLDDEKRDTSKDVDGVVADRDAIMPVTKRNEILGKLREGIEDTSISRTQFSWGVSIPDDPEHVLWVWYDALINYISGQMKNSLQDDSADSPELSQLIQDPAFKQNWPVVHHLIGKDILWQHSVVWFSMLHGAGLEMPHRVFAHGWWTAEGDKMSKTLGNVVRPLEMTNKYGRDAFRYFLLREGPSKSDADWRHEAFIGRINSDLAGEFGNLLSRCLGMLGKYCEGVVPAAPVEVEGASELREIAGAMPAKLREAIDQFSFPQALDALWELVRRCNRFVDETRPFSLAKEEGQRDRLESVMHALLQSLRVMAYLFDPFLPDAALQMREQLGLTDAEVKSLDDACQWSDEYVGTQTTKGESLFPRVED